MKSRYLTEDWEQFEEEVAAFLDGRRQPGSGAPIMAKGDVKSEDYLTECKFTEKEDYVLNIKTYEKIAEEARNQFRIPLFACRSQAGDFFVGEQIDFDPDEIGQDFIELDLKDKKSVHISEPFVASFQGERCVHDIVCWRINWEMM